MGYRSIRHFSPTAVSLEPLLRDRYKMASGRAADSGPNWQAPVSDRREAGGLFSTRRARVNPAFPRISRFVWCQYSGCLLGDGTREMASSVAPMSWKAV